MPAAGTVTTSLKLGNIPRRPTRLHDRYHQHPGILEVGKPRSWPASYRSLYSSSSYCSCSRVSGKTRAGIIMCSASSASSAPYWQSQSAKSRSLQPTFNCATRTTTGGGRASWWEEPARSGSLFTVCGTLLHGCTLKASFRACCSSATAFLHVWCTGWSRGPLGF